MIPKLSETFTAEYVAKLVILNGLDGRDSSTCTTEENAAMRAFAIHEELLPSGSFFGCFSMAPKELLKVKTGDEWRKVRARHPKIMFTNRQRAIAAIVAAGGDVGQVDSIADREGLAKWNYARRQEKNYGAMRTRSVHGDYECPEEGPSYNVSVADPLGASKEATVTLERSESGVFDELAVKRALATPSSKVRLGYVNPYPSKMDRMIAGLSVVAPVVANISKRAEAANDAA